MSLTSRISTVLVAGLSLFLTSGCPSKGGGTSPPARPATATANLRFADVAASAGVRFRHYIGADGRFFAPESVGPGGAFIDYDGDGWLDLYLVNGSNWPDRPEAHKSGALYRNQQDGTFRDVTREAGLVTSFYGMGCAVGDYDNDGHDDLLLTGMGKTKLFHNTGKGRFTDVTPGSGLDRAAAWEYYTSAAWFDYDRDGKLDLFVCRYIDWSPQKDVPCRSGLGKRIHCGPNQYGTVPSQLFRNLGQGRFQDVTGPTGIAKAAGKALGVLPIDEDGDGWLDLFVSNDTTPNHLFRNEGGKRFREVAQELGVAVDENGRWRSGMGIDVADVHNNEGLAFTIGNFVKEGISLYDRAGNLYSDTAIRNGLIPASLPCVTFGLTYLDADRDGWQDLFTYNGHVDQHAEEAGGDNTYRQLPQLFQNHAGTFTEVGKQAGPAFLTPQVGRGCAWGDFDNDGKPDLLLFENAGPTRLLKNETADQNHWLGIRLEGTRGNRNGYGAEVRATIGGVTQRRWVRSGGSYLSHSDTRALFGLGSATVVDRLEVRWPSGATSVEERLTPDRYLTLKEPPGA